MIEIIFKAVFYTKVKVQISLYWMALAMASKSFNKFALFENQDILGWSIMLFVDWLIWWLLLKREF